MACLVMASPPFGCHGEPATEIDRVTFLGKAS
jgi:hypothetical protein